MASPKIRVRSYNVGFGDCFLVTIPDGAQLRHLLIDFGNAPGKAGSNESFPDIAANILEETGGHLDVVVMTHEHLDHMEGFYSQRKVFDTITVDQVWMGLPSHPTYYEDFPDAEPQRKLRAAAVSFARTLDARQARGLQVAPSFEAMLLNNLSNQDRIDYVRNLAAAPVKYLHRGSTVRGKPASAKVKFRFLAPEKDVSVYYSGGAQRMSMMAASLSAAGGDQDRWSFPNAKRIAGDRPLQLSPGDWGRLRDSIRMGAVDAIRSIDKAANNTSLVFVVEAAGKRLLFPGDAELESWEMMKEKARRHLKPVDFLKVAHHGSHNGTPLELLDEVLPVSRKDRATIMVSTRSKVYGTRNPVPDDDLLEELGKRCRRLVSTDDLSPATRWVDVEV